MTKIHHFEMTHFRLKDGPITVAWFDADYNGYQFVVGQGEAMDGPGHAK